MFELAFSIFWIDLCDENFFAVLKKLRRHGIDASKCSEFERKCEMEDY